MKSIEGIHDFEDFAIFPKEPLPPKYHMPEMTKFNGSGDPRVHLQHYATVMRASGLSIKNHILNYFPLYLDGIVVSWYHDHDKNVKNDWR